MTAISSVSYFLVFFVTMRLTSEAISALMTDVSFADLKATGYYFSNSDFCVISFRHRRLIDTW